MRGGRGGHDPLEKWWEGWNTFCPPQKLSTEIFNFAVINNLVEFVTKDEKIYVIMFGFLCIPSSMNEFFMINSDFSYCFTHFLRLLWPPLKNSCGHFE